MEQRAKDVSRTREKTKKRGGKSKLVLGASLVDVDVSSLEGSGELAARTLHNDVASVDLDLH